MITLTSFPPGLRYIKDKYKYIDLKYVQDFSFIKRTQPVYAIYLPVLFKSKRGLHKNLPPSDRVSCVRAFEERAATRCCYIPHEKVHATV